MGDDKCRPVVVDGEVIRVHGGAEMDATDLAYFADIVRAAKRKFAAETPEPPMEGKQKPTTRNGAPRATPASSTTGRAPVAGPSNTTGKAGGGLGELRPSPVVGTPEPCPECVQGKHRNCDGCTWDNDADGLCACPCAERGHRP